MDRWESFYVIIGSSGAALVGIQFLVLTLISNMRHRPPIESAEAFASPTVVHFVTSLVIAAVMSVPWPSVTLASVALAACGFAGLVYSVVVAFRARRQTFYRPVWQDWLWYVVLPCVAYGSLLSAALMLRVNVGNALLAIGASALGLLLIGIHNAWDSVIHLVIGAGADQVEGE